MTVRGVFAAIFLATASVTVGGCEDPEARPIDVARSDGGAAGAATPSVCELAADHVMSLCQAAACSSGTVGPACRTELVNACQTDQSNADAVFKYMCRLNARECAEAQACRI